MTVLVKVSPPCPDLETAAEFYAEHVAARRGEGQEEQ